MGLSELLGGSPQLVVGIIYKPSFIYKWDNPRIWDFLTKVTKLLSNAPQKYVILILSFKWCSAIRFLTTPTADIIFSV